MFRMQNNLPKVGIRPVIDGRRNGVRESLEDTTMNMAKIAAKLIEENIKHPSGEKVECVISDTTIGGVAEAARCQKKFDENNVKLTLTVTPCWCYGSETIDMTPAIPKAIWGFNGTERPGAVYLAAADAGHTQLGLPVFSIYGKDVQDAGDENIPEDVREKILRFVRAGLAVATMKDQSYVSMGYVAMGIMGSMVDAEFLLDYLGMRTEFVDMSEIKRRLELEIYDKEEFKKAWEWAKQCKFGSDNNKVKASDEQKEKEWATSIKMAMIMRDLMVGNPKLAEMGYIEEAQGHNAIVGGFQGQRHWTDFMPNGDFAEAILNSSFDWNGIREPYVVATENDSLNGLSMLFAHLLTSRSQLFADVRTYWSPEAVKRVTGKELTGKAKDGIIHLINSGAASLDWTGEQKVNGNPALKEYWNITEEEAKKCLDATQFSPANREYFRGGGFSSTFLTKGEMPMTIIRLNLVKGFGPVLQIAEGYAVNIDDSIFDPINKRTDSTWPTTWFAPILTGKDSFKDVYSVMNDWGANHCAAAYGHIGADLITLASMLRIPVSMHNVSEDRIFRPKAWKAFGTKDAEGADFRACKHFGPLFGKVTR
ncbi:L-fucose isomerase [Brachyspira murdochii]|uniref:L-fucose isomerase n=1 Tax=Brachyspira murdochii TaxID=84378 RepID=UPI00300594A4